MFNSASSDKDTEFDWCDYYNLAKELNDNEDLNEAKLRAIISRAYYSAFCKSRNYLRDSGDLDLQDKNGRNRHGEHFNVHEYVGREFSNNKNPSWQDIGKFLIALRVHRNSADYHDKFEGKLQLESEMSLKLSKDILKNLENLY